METGVVTVEGMGEVPEAGHIYPATAAGQGLVQGLEHNGDSIHWVPEALNPLLIWRHTTLRIEMLQWLDWRSV